MPGDYGISLFLKILQIDLIFLYIV